jgi:hypothetical protein
MSRPRADPTLSLLIASNSTCQPTADTLQFQPDPAIGSSSTGRWTRMQYRQTCISSILSPLLMSLALIWMGSSASALAAEPESSTASARQEEIRKLIDERRRAMREGAGALAESRRWENLSPAQQAEAHFVSEAQLELTDLLKEFAPPDGSTPARCGSLEIQFPIGQASAPQVCVEASLQCDEQNFSGLELEVAKRPGMRIENLRMPDRAAPGSRYQFDLCKKKPHD